MEQDICHFLRYLLSRRTTVQIKASEGGKKAIGQTQVKSLVQTLGSTKVRAVLQLEAVEALQEKACSRQPPTGLEGGIIVEMFLQRENLGNAMGRFGLRLTWNVPSGKKLRLE